jgi:nucleoid DNA-binding protein
MNATKESLILATANATGDSVKWARYTIEAFLKEIKTQWVSGGTVSIRGFGTMTSKQTKARIGRNPKTGATIPISARRRLHFRVSGQLQKRAE